MIYFSDDELQRYIHDDIPYFDLTTSLQNAKNRHAKLSIFTREELMVSCSEEAQRIALLLGCHVKNCMASKTIVKKVKYS